MNFNIEDYAPVQERITQFYRDHPDGRIVTRLESLPDDFGQCRYRADCYRAALDTLPAASGHAVGIAGGKGPAALAWEETAETSAIGRALANLGYAKSRQDRPSREEMIAVSSRNGRAT